MHRDVASAVRPLRREAEIVRAPGGELVFRSQGQWAVVNGVATSDLDAILDQADGGHSRAFIVNHLHPRVARPVVESVLDALATLNAPPGARTPFKPLTTVPGTEPVDSPVCVVGNGRLARAIRDRLRRHHVGHVDVLDVDAFLTIQSPEFQATLASRVVRGHLTHGPHATTGTAWNVSALAAEFAKAQLIVCALEETWGRAVLDVNAASIAARRPVMFVTMDPVSIHVGPSHVPGRTACFECADAGAPEPVRATFELCSLDALRDGDAIERALDLVAIEARSLLASTTPSQTMTRVVSFPRRNPWASASPAGAAPSSGPWSVRLPVSGR
jgi:hypothetical protein